MKYDSTSGSWARVPWPAVVQRIRAMYQVEALVVDDELGDGRLWADASHPSTLAMLKKHKEEGLFDLPGVGREEEEDERILRPDS